MAPLGNRASTAFKLTGSGFAKGSHVLTRKNKTWSQQTLSPFLGLISTHSEQCLPEMEWRLTNQPRFANAPAAQYQDSEEGRYAKKGPVKVGPEAENPVACPDILHIASIP